MKYLSKATRSLRWCQNQFEFVLQSLQFSEKATKFEKKILQRKHGLKSSLPNTYIIEIGYNAFK